MRPCRGPAAVLAAALARVAFRGRRGAYLRAIALAVALPHVVLHTKWVAVLAFLSLAALAAAELHHRRRSVRASARSRVRGRAG